MCGSFLRFYLVVVTIFFFTNASAQVGSDFAANADGWTTPNDADGTIAYAATGGNPTGHVFGTPFSFNTGAGTVFVYFYFVAPAKFLGNRSTYYDGTLRFDLQQSSTGTAVPHAEVIITTGSAAPISLYYYPTTTFQPPAPAAWTTFSVVLGAGTGFWKTADSSTGPVATEAQIRNVLANLTGLQIRGLFRDANTTNRLDNVTLMPPIVVTTQPTTIAVCDGTPVTLSTAATGNAAITYQWQRETTPSVWANVTNTGGYTGATTSTLSINTTGSFGNGVYRVRLSGTAVEDAFTNTATVTVNAIPAAPTTTGASSCAPGSLTLTATGAGAGQYRWYVAATGGLPIAGQTSGSFITPVLSATTTYYVAINSGTCEGNRAPAAATFNTPPNAPGTTGGSSCLAGSVTLKAAGGAAGQYRWYTSATGGIAIAGAVNANFATPVLSVTTTYYAAINNGTCESTRTAAVATIAAPGCDNHPPVIATQAVSTQIEGKISLDLETLITDSDNNLDLSTLSIVTPPSSGASASIDADHNLIINYNGRSFAGTESITIQVCDFYSACVQQTFSIEVKGEIEIFNAVSPGNDGKNDVFYISHIDQLKDTQKNHVTIYNRWGDMVWEGVNYNNTTVSFTGRSSNNNELPSGTYYYKIEFTGRKTLMGFLSLRR